VRLCTLPGRISNSADHRLRSEHISNCNLDLDYGIQLQHEFNFDFGLPNQQFDGVSIILVVDRC